MANYDEDEVYGQDDAVPANDESLRDVVARAPWWMISIAVHAVLISIALFLAVPEPEPQKIAFLPAQLVDDVVPVPEPEDAFERQVETDTALTEVAVHDSPVDSVTAEDPVDQPFEEPLGTSDATGSAPLQGKLANTPIGLGAGAAGAFKGRGGKKGLGKNGGDKITEIRVARALEWLDQHQDKDRGCWDSDDFQACCRKNTCSGRGGDGYDPGQTGLALLAFLGAGNTHQNGRYKDTVQRGVRYLISVQDAAGCFGPQSGEYMYNHAIAALAMAEAYGMTKSPLLNTAAQRGIDFLVRAQNPGLGWRYQSASGENDTSVTGWAVMALKSARVAELAVPVAAFAGARNWLDSVTDDQYYRTGYLQRGDRGSRLRDSARKFAAAESCTAISVMCRIFMGDERGDALLAGQGDILSQNLPTWDTNGGPDGTSRLDYYYWYYGTLAMFQLGGDHWKSWNQAMKNALVKHQREDGDEAGSWDPIDAWGPAGGRVYATAINVLSLEIYYRYDRAFK